MQRYSDLSVISKSNFDAQESKPLDTLAREVTKEGVYEAEKPLSPSHKSFINRRIAKAITSKMIFPFMDLNSSLKPSYLRTLSCNEILLQDGLKVSSKYCKNRFCVVCNRIKTAKVINEYLPIIDGLSDLTMLTLTIPSVKADQLPSAYKMMLESFRRITRNIKKNYPQNSVIGFRAYECNYNSKKNTFNPHFHILMEGKTNAFLIKNLWLDQIKGASYKAQDVQSANPGALIEIVKYVCKGVVKEQFYPQAMDCIFRSLRGKKVFETFGIKKINLDMNTTSKTVIDFRTSDVDVWAWNHEVMNWTNSTGELFIDHVFDQKTMDFLNKIK